MADKRISELTTLVWVDDNDYLVVVDRSDLTMSVDGTTKKTLKTELKGETGDNATANAGTTTTLVPWASATVVNSWTTSDAIFDFSIPAGSVIHRTVGIPSNSIGVNGDWWFDTSSASEVYFKAGGAWSLVSSNKGATGATGATWATGNGIDNISLISTVGKVKTYRITYTDATTFDYVVTDGADGSGDMTKAVYDPANGAKQVSFAADVIPKTQNALTKDPTGFNDPSAVVINYDATTQKVTLTGTWVAYYQGEVVTALTSGWVSPAHTNTTGHTYFLYYDGSNFAWATDTFPWFDKLFIAIVYYRASNSFANRECHGLQQWQSHQNDHYNIGTYRTAGGDISGLTLASTTAANRRPDISACTIWDEDLPTINAALTSKLYSQRYISNATDINYNLDAADIVPLSTANPYYNQWNGSAFVQTLMPANSVMTVWLYEIPVTADATSQKIRHVMIQGQSITQATNSSAGALVTARNTEKLKTTLELTLGVPSVVSSEYVCINKFIIQYTSSNWTVTDSIAITGSKTTQVGSPSGSYLTAVSTDTSLTGDGTVASPLSVSNAFTTIELGNASDTTLSRVSAGVIAVEGVTIPSISSTNTLTNKRITKRVVTTTDDATAVIDWDVTDTYELSAVANATTFTLTGTPTNSQKIMIRFKDAGVAKALTWTGFTAIGVTLPTTTVAGKWHYVGIEYNSAASQTHVIAVGVQA